ncbi:MAG TPA: phosphatidylglycerophosphatase A [Solirubrobacteraceae bacterium]
MPRPSALDRLAVLIATVFGVGHAPLAPGTVASVVTVMFLGLVPFSRAGLVAFLVVVVAVGTWAAHVAERVIGGKDPGAIVIDEVAGMTLSVVAFPLTPEVLAAGLALFRVFDVLKPPPARESQRITGGVGVMIDDLIAGFYALVIIALMRRLLGWP